MEIRYKIWLEKDGKVIFGQGREKLFEAIEECHSLNAAAKKLKDKKGKGKDKDKTAEKKEEAPKPSVPAKKGKDKDKKAEKKDKKSGTSCDKPVAKKRKASVALTASVFTSASAPL